MTKPTNELVHSLEHFSLCTGCNKIRCTYSYAESFICGDCGDYLPETKAAILKIFSDFINDRKRLLNEIDLLKKKMEMEK